MVKMICFDMDGTIADLYGVNKWLEKLRDYDPTPYLEAKPLFDMDALRQVLGVLIDKGWEIRVISWLSKESNKDYDNLVRKAKRQWLADNNFPVHKIHLVKYGTTKANCVRNDTDMAILVDDNAKVRRGWHLGDTIDPTTTDIVSALAALLD